MDIYIIRKITIRSTTNDNLYLLKIKNQCLLTAYCQTLRYQGWEGLAASTGETSQAAGPRARVIPSTFQNKTQTLSTRYSTLIFGRFLSPSYTVVRLLLIPFKHPKLCSGAWPEKELKCLLNT